MPIHFSPAYGASAGHRGGWSSTHHITLTTHVQDIAVDGLALTILSEQNRELGATCNAIGQTLGYFFSYVGFLGLQAYGLATLGGFMAFWGWVFIGSTLWVVTVRRDEHHRQVLRRSELWLIFRGAIKSPFYCSISVIVAHNDMDCMMRATLWLV